MERKPTRAVRIGKVQVGGGAPIVVQSMCATKTTDVDAPVAQVHQLEKAGAGIVRRAERDPCADDSDAFGRSAREL
jgi:(E)-4-hydroxy-3-methylbut-2-enyl-diphosphate synthase